MAIQLLSSHHVMAVQMLISIFGNVLGQVFGLWDLALGFAVQLLLRVVWGVQDDPRLFRKASRRLSHVQEAKALRENLHEDLQEYLQEILGRLSSRSC